MKVIRTLKQADKEGTLEVSVGAEFAAEMLSAGDDLLLWALGGDNYVVETVWDLAFVVERFSRVCDVITTRDTVYPDDLRGHFFAAKRSWYTDFFQNDEGYDGFVFGLCTNNDGGDAYFIPGDFIRANKDLCRELLDMFDETDVAEHLKKEFRL